MKRNQVVSAVVCGLLAASLFSAGSIFAQSRNRGRKSPNPRPPNANQEGEQAKQGPMLPDDPKLLALHKEFVVSAEKLAKDYEKNRDIEKARVCYQEILRLVPGYPDAEEALAKILEKEASASRKVMDVHANKDWQDTGIDLIQGKPVVITASGTWNFRMSNQLGPEGMEIPEELRDFNLGSLIGVVAVDDPKDAKPFYIGPSYEFRAEKSGRLLLRMYDSDPSDNSGKLSVEIRGTFDR